MIITIFLINWEEYIDSGYEKYTILTKFDVRRLWLSYNFYSIVFICGCDILLVIVYIHVGLSHFKNFHKFRHFTHFIDLITLCDIYLRNSRLTFFYGVLDFFLYCIISCIALCEGVQIQLRGEVAEFKIIFGSYVVLWLKRK